MFDLSKAVKSKGNRLPITIQRHEPIREGVASRIMLTIGGSDPHRMPSKAEIAAAFDEQFDNQASIVTDSLHIATDGIRSGILTAIVLAKRATTSLNAALAKGFKEIASNVFADADDTIWEVADNDAAGIKMLVRKEADDLEALLGSRQSRSIVTAASSIDLHADVNKSTAVLYTDLASGETTFGIAVALNTEEASFDAYLPKADKVVSGISTLQVIAYSGNSVQPDNVPYVDTASVSTDKALDYYRRLYGSQPEYLAKIEEVLRVQAARSI